MHKKLKRKLTYKPLEEEISEFPQVKKIIEENYFLSLHLNEILTHISKFTQEISKNTNTIDIIIELLVSMVEDMKMLGETPTKLKILSKIHLILAEIVHNNYFNADYVAKQMAEFIQEYLYKDRVGYNIIILINTVIRNNKRVLYNLKESTRFAQKLFDQFLFLKKNKMRL